jgi:glycosyltransferase involved in cell wall biosynthesis
VRILFLNQYFPPDPAPTGALFAEIADALQPRGHQVRFIDAGQEYRGGQGRPGRLRRELFALNRMLHHGIQEPQPDVVVSGTSPPCLAFVAQLIALRHRAESIHWCMDLYPEIAVALGEIKAGWLSRIAGGIMGWSYRRTSTVVALDSDMAARLRKHGVNSQIIRPWVMNWRENPLPDAHSTTNWTWLYSGNLGRAHEWQTLLEAQAILEKENRNISLVFQGGGPSWNVARSHADALGLKQIEWRPYVPESEVQSSLLQAQSLVVTQRVEVQGMLWPSKLALMLALPRPILFVGPVDGDISRSLRAMPHSGVYAPGDARGVATWLAQTKERGLSEFAGNVVDPKAHRAACLEKWVEIVESCGPKADARPAATDSISLNKVGGCAS